MQQKCTFPNNGLLPKHQLSEVTGRVVNFVDSKERILSLKVLRFLDKKNITLVSYFEAILFRNVEFDTLYSLREIMRTKTLLKTNRERSLTETH